MKTFLSKARSMPLIAPVVSAILFISFMLANDLLDLRDLR